MSDDRVDKLIIAGFVLILLLGVYLQGEGPNRFWTSSASAAIGGLLMALNNNKEKK